MTIQVSQAPEAETSSPSPEPPGAQLQRDFKERVQAGLEKAGHKRDLDDVANSDVIEDDSVEDTPAPPKGANGAASRGRPAAAAAEGGKKASPEGKDSSGGDDTEPGKRPQPRYDSRSFAAWIQNNPDKAAELATKVFKTQLGGNAEAWKQHFISAENGRRRHAEQVEKDRQAHEANKAELDRLAREAREPVEKIIDVIEAEQKEDFPAIDRFIKETFGITIDEFQRRRLRGLSKETDTERAQKQKIAALEKKLAEAAGASGKAEGDDGDGKSKRPQVSQKWIESEIGEDHGVRDLGDWQAKVRAAYQESYDEEADEYGLSIEDAAEQVLDAFLKKRTSPPPAKDGKGKRPTQRSRPAQAKESARERSRRVWTDDDEDGARTPTGDIDDEVPPEDFQARTRWALSRAGKRR